MTRSRPESFLSAEPHTTGNMFADADWGIRHPFRRSATCARSSPGPVYSSPAPMQSLRYERG